MKAETASFLKEVVSPCKQHGGKVSVNFFVFVSNLLRSVSKVLDKVKKQRHLFIH